MNLFFPSFSLRGSRKTGREVGGERGRKKREAVERKGRPIEPPFVHFCGR